MVEIKLPVEKEGLGEHLPRIEGEGHDILESAGKEAPSVPGGQKVEAALAASAAEPGAEVSDLEQLPGDTFAEAGAPTMDKLLSGGRVDPRAVEAAMRRGSTPPDKLEEWLRAAHGASPET